MDVKTSEETGGRKKEGGKRIMGRVAANTGTAEQLGEALLNDMGTAERHGHC